MSGGVDSSVAAALLVEQGYDVVGMMLRLWSEPGDGGGSIANRCCSPKQMADARHVAHQLGIPFYVLDVQDYFRQTVVQFFIDQHTLGHTPNPCIECNRRVRFSHLLDHALALNAQYLATGHYARVHDSGRGFRLLAGIDTNKDQSYVLHVLGQRHLSHTLFPIGTYTKKEVRQMARRFNLPVDGKHESQDLCFLSDGDHHRFLQEHNANITGPGPILDKSGRQLGQHDGLPFYTIGQRKGLGITTPERIYVIHKDISSNALVVGGRESLGRRGLLAQNVNWVSGVSPQRPIEAQVKIRYKAEAVSAVVTPRDGAQADVCFDKPVFGITSGQGAVFYDGDVCLGGGIIFEDQLNDPAFNEDVPREGKR
jgi:tRNA-specific 2-thiouridylase